MKHTVLILAALAAVLPGAAQAPVAQPGDRTTIKTTVQEVVLDLIVRDRRGKLVNDLAPGDIVVTENGTEQRITSVRLVSGLEFIQQDAQNKEERKPLDIMHQVRLVTLAFDRLGADGRRFARQGALDLLKQPLEQNVFYAVVWFDPQVRIIQNFTNDRNKLRAAVEHVTSAGSGGARTSSREAPVAPPSSSMPAEPASTSGPGAAGQGAAAAEAAYQQVIANVNGFIERTIAAQAGADSITALSSTIRAQQSIEGRKTILYFAEGLDLPQQVLPLFRAAIAEANRYNTSIYTVDARGLVTESQIGRVREGMVATSQDAGGGLVNRSNTISADVAIESMRKNRQGNLGELAEATGGFLVADSNDLRQPLRRVLEDANAYYEISYVPSNTEWDGALRDVSVRVNRPNVVVQSRRGYFALPPGMPGVAPHELALLQALGTVPPPRNVEFRSATYRFLKSGEGVECAFDVEVPLRNFTVRKDEAANTYLTHLTALVVFKDAGGQVVRRFSRDLPLQGPLDRLPGFQEGNFIYTDHAPLPPGRYTVETAVHDRLGGKIGVKKASLVVAPPPSGIGLSDIVFVRRLDRAEAAAGDPFRFSGGKVTPSLASTFPAGKGSQLSIYFVVLPAVGAAEKAKVMIDVIADGKLVARSESALPAPEPDGRVPIVASPSIESLTPGSYELRVAAIQGTNAAESKAFFNVE